MKEIVLAIADGLGESPIQMVLEDQIDNLLQKATDLEGSKLVEARWDKLFLMLMIGALIAGLLLSKLIFTETADMLNRKQSANAQCFGGSTSQPLLTDEQR